MTTATALVPRTPAELALAGPLGSFEAYAERVSRIPVLTREEERRWPRFHHENDLDAARELVMSHLRFVLHIAAATPAMACRWATWCRKATSA